MSKVADPTMLARYNSQKSYAERHWVLIIAGSLPDACRPALDAYDAPIQPDEWYWAEQTGFPVMTDEGDLDGYFYLIRSGPVCPLTFIRRGVKIPDPDWVCTTCRWRGYHKFGCPAA